MTTEMLIAQIEANEEAGMAEMAATYAAFEILGLEEEAGWALLCADEEARHAD